LEYFDEWGLDFLGPVDPPSDPNMHILVCINYLKNWDEMKAMKVAIKDKVAHFFPWGL